MLRIRTIKSVAPRVRYFLDDPALAAHEKEGIWLGEASERLALPAKVDKTTFQAALEGFAPNGDYLGQVRKPNRRAAWDIVLTTNKSISVAAFCGDDPKLSSVIQTSWQAACRDFVPILQSLAAHADAGRPLIPTRSLLVAAFTHDRSRRSDPLLHTHFIVVNTTFNAQRGYWRGLEASPFFRHNMLLDAAFQRELHRHLLSHGLTSVLDAKGRAHLPEVSPALCHRLSAARNAIDEAELTVTLPSPPLFSGRNRAALRNRLNDRLRPPKTAAPSPLPALVSETERAGLRLPISPPPPPEPPPSLRVIAQQIEDDYLRRGLWHTTKRLFAATLHVSRLYLSASFAHCLESLSFVRSHHRHRPAPDKEATAAARERSAQAFILPPHAAKKRQPKTPRAAPVTIRARARTRALMATLSQPPPARTQVRPQRTPPPLRPIGRVRRVQPSQPNTTQGVPQAPGSAATGKKPPWLGS